MSKVEIAALVEDCRAIDWRVETTAKNRQIVYPPDGDPIPVPTTGNGRSLANFRADLQRAGFNPDIARAAKEERAINNTAAAHAKNEAALERAAQRAKEAAMAPVPLPMTMPTATNPVLANPFAPPPVSRGERPSLPGTGVPNAATLLKGYPKQDILVTQAQAREWLEKLEEGNRARQRHLYYNNWTKFQQAMELGEWELNPADSLVLDTNGLLINGQHRMKALSEADPEFIELSYPDGVPFSLTTDFPPELAHIFDTGRARSAADALTVEGLQGWGPLASGALRLALNYDRSFMPGGVGPWGQWRSLQWTNTELVKAVSKGGYGALLENKQIVSRAYSQSRITRSATMVAAFLINRDNPGGCPAAAEREAKTNEEFWSGISGDADMKAGDPRMAVMRAAVRTTGKSRVENGPTMLAHLLKGYANYMIGDKKVDISTVDKERPMPPVWRPGMRWFGQELRYPKVGAREG